MKLTPPGDLERERSRNGEESVSVFAMYDSEGRLIFVGLVVEVVGTDDDGGGDEESIKGGETADQEIGRDLRSLGGVSGRAFGVNGVPLLRAALGTGPGDDLVDDGSADIPEHMDRRNGSRVRRGDPAAASCSSTEHKVLQRLMFSVRSRCRQGK